MNDRISLSLHSIFLLTVLLLSVGCSRAFYRTQADAEVHDLVESVASDPRWPLKDFTIEVDPRSRMYDGFCPDCEPMPLDDPTSHKYMHCVDGKSGYPCWHANGDTDVTENPYWLEQFEYTKDGEIILDINAAYRTSLVNSVDYQEELEDLYLSALDVTFERFRFDVQFFAGHSTTYTADGPARAGDSSSLLNLSTFPAGRNFQASKLFSTGSELMVGFANSLVWEFSGSNTYTASSLIDFSLVQPLLRQAGRDVVLERLTLTERALLSNVRQMERFRRGFFAEIVTGRDAGPGPSRRGGVFGGSGLGGFTGLGGGGFGQLTGGGGLRGFNGFGGGAGAASAGGFYGLLQTQQEIKNTQVSVDSLRDSLERLIAASASPNLGTSETIRLNFQVELARQALHNAESRLLSARAGYQSGLDSYKLGLGLPPELNVVVRDPLLEQFEILDPGLSKVQAATDNTLVLMQPQPVASATYRQNLEGFLAELKRFEKVLALGLKLHSQATDKLTIVDTSVKKVAEVADERRASLNRLANRIDVKKDNIATEVLDVKKFNKLLSNMQSRLKSIHKEIVFIPGKIRKQLKTVSDKRKQVELELSKLDGDGKGDITDLLNQRKKTFSNTSIQLRELSGILSEMWLIQAKARLESITLTAIKLKPEKAIKVAEQNRLDWKNARASLVDAWRLIEFNADDLESDLDIVFSGDLSNTKDRPFHFNSTTGRLRASLQFDAPITRLSERNNYRQSLIDYQRARRNYYQFVDQVYRTLRNSLRTIELNELNFELRRAAVHVALTQVDLAREQLQAPLQVGQTSQPGEIGRDLVTALAELVSVQNDFLSVWLNQRVQQISLDFDLGTMKLDEEGIWIPRNDFSPSSLGIPEEDDSLLRPIQPSVLKYEEVGPPIDNRTDLETIDKIPVDDLPPLPKGGGNPLR